MVLGEPQILGQMKEAVRTPKQAGTLGILLHKLFQRTFSVAKEVRTHDRDRRQHRVHGGRRGAAGRAHLPQHRRAERAVHRRRRDDRTVRRRTSPRSIRKRITVANRTLERAQALAQRFNGRAIALNELPEQLAQLRHRRLLHRQPAADPRQGHGRARLKARKHRPMFMVDLAVPRDIEAEVGRAGRRVPLHAWTTWRQVVRDGMDAARRAVAQAEAIIDSGVADFMHWMEAREVVPTIRALRDHAERYAPPRTGTRPAAAGQGRRPAAGAGSAVPRPDQQIPARPTHALNQAQARAERAPLPHARAATPCYPHASIARDVHARLRDETYAIMPDQARPAGERLEELDALLSSEDATRDMDNYRKLTREHAELDAGGRAVPRLPAGRGGHRRPRRKCWPTRR